jgi:transposase
MELELFDETLGMDLSEVEAIIETVAPEATGEDLQKRKPVRRKSLPPELPREEYRHEPESCQCGQCGKGMVQIGESVTELLDIIPAKFFVQKHIYPQYACRDCEIMEVAPVAPAIIDRGLATPGLLAWVMTAKYGEHLPLYRLEQIAERSGVELARSTMADWVGRVGVALQPLVNRLRKILGERKIIHADETPVRQLDPGSGKTKRAYLWAYCSAEWETGPPILVFDYQESRQCIHARTFLDKWKGHLMVDDYSGYKSIFGPAVTELGCMAHARRKFFDLHAEQPRPVTEQALTWFAKLYEAERAWKGLGVEERARKRHEVAIPLLEKFHHWLLQQRKTTAPGSGLAKALDYTLRRWEALARYATQGDLPIDNNRVGNAIRPIAVGKKNWLFAGSARAGVRAAAIQTLLGTARMNGLEPYAWLKDTLMKLPAWPNARLDELLPLAMPQTHDTLPENPASI